MDDLYQPDANDPYQDVALIFAGFQCENCGDYCAGNPNGSHENPLASDGSQQLDCVTMARVVRELGWRVSAAPMINEFRILCPRCARG